MVLDAAFNNISVISWEVLLVEEIGVPFENHRPIQVTDKTLSHSVVSSTPSHEQGSNSQLLQLPHDHSCDGSTQY